MPWLDKDFAAPWEQNNYPIVFSYRWSISSPSLRDRIIMITCFREGLITVKFVLISQNRTADIACQSRFFPSQSPVHAVLVHFGVWNEALIILFELLFLYRNLFFFSTVYPGYPGMKMLRYMVIVVSKQSTKSAPTAFQNTSLIISWVPIIGDTIWRGKRTARSRTFFFSTFHGAPELSSAGQLPSFRHVSARIVWMILSFEHISSNAFSKCCPLRIHSLALRVKRRA